MSRRVTPAIAMDPQIHGSYECELNNNDERIYQYHAVKPGTNDYQVHAMEAGDDSGDGTIVEGIAQEDALEHESVKVVLFGPTWAYCYDGGAITRNQLLEAIHDAADADNGWVRPITGASYTGKMITGMALEGCVALAKFKMIVTRMIVVKAD